MTNKTCAKCDEEIEKDDAFFVVDGKPKHPECNKRSDTEKAHRIVFHDPSKNEARVIKSRSNFDVLEQDFVDAGLAAT